MIGGGGGGVYADTSNNYYKFGYIYLTGQGFVNRQFKGSGIESALGWEELVWGEEPTRNNAFALGTIDDIDIGLVARCEVNFKYFSYKDYLDFKKIITSRHFTATFFNVDTNNWITREMYCSSNERQRIHNFGTDLLGIADFNVKLVGTNNDLTNIGTTMTVKYYNSDGTLLDTDTSTTWSQQYNLKTSSILPGGTTGTLVQWNTKQDGSGFSYTPNEKITLWEDLNLYAIISAVDTSAYPVKISLYTRTRTSGGQWYRTEQDSDTTKSFGDVYTVPAFLAGYSDPIEWDTDINRKGKKYQPGDKIALVGDLALYLILVNPYD